MIRTLGMAGAYNGNRYLRIDSNSSKCLYSTLHNEGVMCEPEEKMGGIIIFPTNIDYNNPSDRVNKIKQFMLTLKNITGSSKIDSIASNFKIEGWTIGHYLYGKYYDPHTGHLFNEKSLSLEMIGIDIDNLISIAEDLCVAFCQQSVLVKSYSNLQVVFVGPSI